MRQTIKAQLKKGCLLSVEDKAHNKRLSKQGVFIEDVNRRCKVFRIVKEVYRGKYKNLFTYAGLSGYFNQPTLSHWIIRKGV